LNVHYLSTGLDLEITLAADALSGREHDAQLADRVDLSALKAKLGARNVTLAREIGAAKVRVPGHA
jgi:hypothetical protein